MIRIPQTPKELEPLLTIETLTDKKQALIQQREQVVANVHAIDGALQVLEELLTQAKPSAPVKVASAK